MRILLALAVLVVAIAGAFYFHDRTTVVVDTRLVDCSALAITDYVQCRNDQLAKHAETVSYVANPARHEAWEDGVALLLVVGGVALAGRIVGSGRSLPDLP